MIYTEENAYTKRCTPMQVIRLMDAERFDALVANGEAQLQCIGSACAQWRWYDPESRPLPLMPLIPSPYVSTKEWHSQRRGYCGLAGVLL